MNGKIVLVGAGPGDPGLLTLAGKKWIERADVVVYDYLANVRLLDFARSDCLLLAVGKHGGGERVEQSVIHELLLQHAREGKLVVRLKGGDPFIFGRGGEEAEIAREAGIPFEVVPGITSAIAAPAYAGIPLTHRDWASNVVFTTGYEYPNKPDLAVRWEELARKGSTLVVLMTQRQLRDNMEKLCAAGRDPKTPAAVIQWGTRAAQRTITGTVGSIASQAEEAGILPPALAVVGEVVLLREELRWYEKKPLFGRSIVVTRPRGQAGVLTELLEEAGAEVYTLPTISIAPPSSYSDLDAALQRAEDYDWLIFTSVNGVQAFISRLRALKIDIRRWHRARVAAIGSQTAAELERGAIKVEIIPREFRAEGLLDALAAEELAGQRILLPRAAQARTILPEELRARGAVVHEVESYRSVPSAVDTGPVRSALLEGRINLLTFTSSSTVHNFAALFRNCLPSALERTEVASIGPITSSTAREYGMKVAVEPSQYTIPALFEAVLRHFAPGARKEIAHVVP